MRLLLVFLLQLDRQLLLLVLRRMRAVVVVATLLDVRARHGHLREHAVACGLRVEACEACVRTRQRGRDWSGF